MKQGTPRSEKKNSRNKNNKIKEERNQPKINEAFGEQNNIDKTLPNAQAAMNMWKKLDKEAEKLVKSENKEKVLENKTTTTTLNLKKK